MIVSLENAYNYTHDSRPQNLTLGGNRDPDGVILTLENAYNYNHDNRPPNLTLGGNRGPDDESAG